MSQIVIMNGSAGVGKTTLSRTLAKDYTSSIVIHGDDLKNFIVNHPDGMEKRLTYKNAAILAQSYIQSGFEIVIIDFVFERPEQVTHFKSFITDDIPVHVFTLWAELPIAILREHNRTGREALGMQVTHSHQAITKHIDQLGHKIDTSHKSIADIMHDIKSAMSAE